MGLAHAKVGSLDVHQTQKVCGQRREVGKLRALVVRQGEGGMHGGGDVDAGRGGIDVGGEEQEGARERGAVGREVRKDRA